MWVWERCVCVLLLFNGVFYKYQWNQVDWWFYLGNLYLYWFSAFLIHRLLREHCWLQWISNYTHELSASLCNSIGFFWSVLTLFLDMYNYKLLCLYEKLTSLSFWNASLILIMLLILKSILSTSAFFRLLLAWYIFLHLCI